MPESRLTRYIAAGVLALIALGLYLRTLHPGVGPSVDSIELQIGGLVQGIVHPPGSPQYLMIAGLLMNTLPGGDPALRLNLFSAVCMAAAVGFTFLITFRLTHNMIASAFAALSLAVAPRIWYLGSITELYALNALYLALTLHLLLAWHDSGEGLLFWAATAVYALSFGNHQSMILFLPVYLYIVWLTDWRMLFSLPNFALVAGIVLIGAAQYLYIPLRAAAEPAFCNYCPGILPDPVAYVTGPLLDYLTGGPFKGAMFGLPPRDVLARIPESIGAFNRQFFPWGYVLGVLGGWELFKREQRLFWVLMLAILPQYVFVMTYNIPDWFDFLVPAYLFFTPLIGYGVLVVWQDVIGPVIRQFENEERPLVGQGIYWGSITLLAAVLVVALYTNIRYVDQSGERAYTLQGEALVAQAEPNAWLLMPPANSAAYYYSWSLRYTSLVNGHESMTVIASPEINPPPGPAPYYLAWQDVEATLAQDIGDVQLFVVDRADPRLAGWGLLPICAGDAVAGYEVVALSRDQPLIEAERWAQVKAQALFTPEQAADCP